LAEKVNKKHVDPHCDNENTPKKTIERWHYTLKLTGKVCETRPFAQRVKNFMSEIFREFLLEEPR